MHLLTKAALTEPATAAQSRAPSALHHRSIKTHYNAYSTIDRSKIIANIKKSRQKRSGPKTTNKTDEKVPQNALFHLWFFFKRATARLFIHHTI